MIQSLPYLQKQLQSLQSRESNNFSKIEKYQKKILQLLVLEKTASYEKDKIQQQLRSLSLKFDKTQDDYEEQIGSLKSKSVEMTAQSQKLEENFESLQTEYRMLQMTHANQQERCESLNIYITTLKNQNEELKEQIQSLEREKVFLSMQTEEQNSQKHKENQEILQKLKGDYENKMKVIENDRKVETCSMQKIIDEQQQQFQDLQTQIAHLNKKIQALSTSENQLKEKLENSESELSSRQLDLSNVSKQLQVTKLKLKSKDEMITQFEIEKQQIQIYCRENSIEWGKLDKENRKLKKQHGSLESKLAEVEDEYSEVSSKYQALNKNYKKVKKELDQLKQDLNEANEFEEYLLNYFSGVKTKFDRLEQSLKTAKQELTQKEESEKLLKEQIGKLEKELLESQNHVIQARHQVDELTKKYEVVSDSKTLLEEKMVLEREESSKSISKMIKEKDLCYRQNYKLLQLLEFRDKAFDQIVKGLEGGVGEEQLLKTFKVELQLQSQDINSQRVIDQIMSSEVKGHKERVAIIQKELKKVQNKQFD